MNRDLGISATTYGLGAGILFFSYALCQLPANMILCHLGARLWVFIILATWGVVSASNAFVQGPISFFILRFFLGVAEAGLFPGMIFYLSLWFPKAYRARFIASFMVASPFSFVIGGPLSSLILGFDGALGLHGWQWLFLLEGIPAIVLGFVVLRFLPNGPREALWLNEDEKMTIAEILLGEESIKRHEFWPALRDPRVTALGVVLFGLNCTIYGVQLWLPQIMQGMGLSTKSVGLILAAPFAAAMAAMVLWGKSSDRRNERVWHVALMALAAAAVFAAASVAPFDILILSACMIGAIAIYAAYGPFFALLSSFLSGAAAAGGVALVNTIGVFGAFLGPGIIGLLKDNTGGYAASMGLFAAMLTVSAGIVLALGLAKSSIADVSTLTVSDPHA